MASARIHGYMGLALVFACAQSPNASSEPTGQPMPERERVPVEIATDSGPVRFSAEIADTPDERALGMMWRTSMKDDDGMIFLFPSPRPLSFWMRNTLMSLDMVFIKSDKTVLGVVAEAMPRTESPRSVPGDSQFVLELKGGTAGARGIRAGQRVDFYAPLPSR